jgi:hypothetical protein
MRVCTSGEGSGSDLGAGGSDNEAGGGGMEYDGRVADIGAPPHFPGARHRKKGPSAVNVDMLLDNLLIGRVVLSCGEHSESQRKPGRSL